jgi:2-phosphoglycerate kinase
MTEAFKVALIGGTSHVGKSTTAAAVAARLGWEALSTDSLARHPGRPWPVGERPVPPHVAEHYSTLAPDELIASVMAHYRGNVWPIVQSLVAERAGQSSAPLVLEGSALLPDLVATLVQPGVRAVWLTAADALIKVRIRRESGYDAVVDAAARKLIAAFVRRSQRFNAEMIISVKRLGLPVVQVTAETAPAEAAEMVLSALRRWASDGA